MQRITKHVSYANVAATLALVFAMTGGAIAATGGFSSSGTLRACANEEGRLKLLKSGEHCKRGLKSVSWSQTGPAGVRGATGAPGATGATGPAGAAGAPGSSGLSASVDWARITEAGTLESGHGIVGSERPGAGVYYVTFDRDITHCALTATAHSANFGRIVNEVLPFEEANATRVAVLTYNNPAQKSENAPFSIVASC
jgi:hypothetical protein